MRVREQKQRVSAQELAEPRLPVQQLGLEQQSAQVPEQVREQVREPRPQVQEQVQEPRPQEQEPLARARPQEQRVLLLLGALMGSSLPPQRAQSPRLPCRPREHESR